MERGAKLGFSALRIVGAVYMTLGAVFAVLGGVFLWKGLGAELGIVGGVFASIGSLFLILGAVFLLLEHRRKKQYDALIAGGRYIWAEVVDIAINHSVHVNGRSPVVLIARHTDGRGREHTFRSRNIRHYRDERLLGKQVRIYIRDEGFKPYYMDVEDILPQTIEH